MALLNIFTLCFLYVCSNVFNVVCNQHPKQINVHVFHNQLNIIMQTPMTFIKFGLALSYWMVGIPIKVLEIPNTFKTKTSFHIAEYLRLVVTALLLSPFCFFQYGKHFSTYILS